MAGSSSSSSHDDGGQQRQTQQYVQSGHDNRFETMSSDLDRLPVYVSECMEDRDALRIVSIQLCADRGSQYSMKDIDEEGCQRLYRLMKNLNRYFVDCLNSHEMSVLGMSPHDVVAWEKNVVHVCVTDIIPGLLEVLMDNSCQMLNFLPIILMSWSSLCSKLLAVRLKHGCTCGDEESVLRVWEEIAGCFDMLCSCLDRSKIEDVLYGSLDAHRRNHATNASHIVLELENEERRTDWVDADSRHLPASDMHRVRARFLTVCVLDVFASQVVEGYKGGMDYLMDALTVSGFECTRATRSLVSVLHTSCALFSDRVKQSSMISSTLMEVCCRFDDVLRRPGLAGIADVGTSHGIPHVFSTFSMMFDIGLVLGGMEEIQSRISGYEKEIVLRLFMSKNVSYQVLAVISMNDIVQDVNRYEDLHETLANVGSLPSRIQWIQSSNIVSEILHANLHHAQYVESILSLLDGLVRYDVVSDVHTNDLWSLLEDDGTFEEIKSNVSHILGFLAARMDEKCAALFCNKLEATQLSASNSKFVEEMMTSAAKFDQSCRLLTRLVDIGTSFALEKDSPDDVDPYSLLLNLYRRYHRHMQEHSMPEYVLVMARVVQSCVSRILKDSLRRLRAPLYLLLKIFRGDILSHSLVLDIYHMVDVEGTLTHNLLHGYGNMLAIHAVSVGSVLSEDLEKVLGIYNDLLRQILSESNYYVSIHQLEMVLQWTNGKQYHAYICDSTWSLLESLVQEEKSIILETAKAFVALALRTIDIKSMSYSSWTCVTAYATSILSWDSTLPLRDASVSYVDFIKMTDSNQKMEIWDILTEFMQVCIIECDNDSIASECTTLLSHILTARMDKDGQSQELNRSVVEYRSLLDESCMKIFGEDINSPALSVSVQLEDLSHPDALKQAQRILTFFQDLLEAYDWRDGPAIRPLYSSFKDEDLAFRVQFQHLPFSPRRYGEQISVDVCCPRNSLVGDLRGIVSQKASDLAGYFIPQENFIIYSKGHLLRNNISRLFEYVEAGDVVYASFSSKPDAKIDSSCANLTSMLSQDFSFVSKLLALQEVSVAINCSNMPVSSYIKNISELALSILLRLPLCMKMGEYIRDGISSMEQTGKLKSETSRPGFLLYYCLFLSSTLSPMNDQIHQQEVCIAPLSILLDEMAQGYAKSRDGLRKQLARALMQFLQKTPKNLPRNSVFLDYARDFILLLVQECLDVDSLYSLSDVHYISSTGLNLVLDLSKEHTLIRRPVLKKLLITLKDIMRYDCEKIRLVGANTIHVLCQEHNLEEVVFTDIIVGILLSKAPSHEEIQLCGTFVSHMDSIMAAEMLPVAERICEKIDFSLSMSQSISGHAKCLQIALLEIDAEDLSPMVALVSRIIDTYLFPKDIILDSGSHESLRNTYSKAFQHCSYVQKEQGGLYRVLLCGALLFPECWKIIFSRISESFQSLEKGFPSLYNNHVVEKLRPFEVYCGLLNGGATCYMNATFQQLFMQPRLRKMLICSPLEKNPEKVSDVFESLRGVFLQMSGGMGNLVDPSLFWRSFKDYDGNPVDVREHQDAYEFFTRLQDSLDEYSKSLGNEKVMYSVLGGSFIQIIEVPEHEGLRSEREEEFYQISVDVRGKKDLIESLESYVAPETLDGENQWHCEELGHKVDAKKKTMLKKLPDTLVFHLKRFEWDFETLSRWKIKDRFEFPQRIDMKPYVDQPNPGEDYMYNLSGVIVHSGTAFAGHYYSYARERSTDKWFLFDDDTVEPWDVSNIDNDCFGGLFVPKNSEKQYYRSQSAYMILYDRRRQEDQDTEDSKFLNMLESMPEDFVTSIMSRNFMEMNKLRAFSPDLADFVSRIGAEIEASISGPRASKTQKSESSAKEVTEFHNEVFNLVGRREGGYPDEVSQAILLCIEYICRIHVYGPCQTADSQSDIATAVLKPLEMACQVPNIAQSVLEACIVGENSLSDAILAAMTSPYKSSRDLLRIILCRCLTAVVLKDKGLCKRYVSDILNHIRSELGSHPSVILKWKDLLGCLSDISADIDCKLIIVDYITDIMSFSQSIDYVWNQLIKGDKEEEGFASSYLQLTLPLLRMHKLSSEVSTTSNDVQKSNPFMIRVSSDSIMREIPDIFDDDDEVSASESVQCLLLPGYLDLIDTELFMKWFAWEDKYRSQVMVRSILGHLDHSSNLKCLASEVAPIITFLKMEDSYTSFRIMEFVCGNGENESRMRALDMCIYLDGSVRAYLISVIIITIRNLYPEMWAPIESNPVLKKKLLLWITGSRNLCSNISERISECGTFRENWVDLIPAEIEPAIKALFDPDKLLEQFETFCPSLLVDTDASRSLDNKERVSTSSMTGSIDGERPLDCIKASDADDQKYEDEVREIDISEP